MQTHARSSSPLLHHGSLPQTQAFTNPLSPRLVPDVLLVLPGGQDLSATQPLSNSSIAGDLYIGCLAGFKKCGEVTVFRLSSWSCRLKKRLESPPSCSSLVVFVTPRHLRHGSEIRHPDLSSEEPKEDTSQEEVQECLVVLRCLLPQETS